MEKIIEQIQKLLLINGCSEHEAYARIAKANELMAKHRITMTDVEIAKEPVLRETFDRVHEFDVVPADATVTGIEAYCGVKVWFTKRNETDLLTGEKKQVRLLTIFGLKQDVAMGYWLYSMINTTLDNEGEEYITKNRFKINKQAEALRAFQFGMAKRICERLKKMAQPDMVTATGTSLVVLKNALIESAYAKLHLKLADPARGGGEQLDSAFRDGENAGDGFTVNKPVTSGEEHQKLEG